MTAERRAEIEAARLLLSVLSSQGVSSAGLSLGVRLFGVPPCPRCDYLIDFCRCPVPPEVQMEDTDG